MINYQLSMINDQWKMNIENCKLKPFMSLLEIVLLDESRG